MRINRSEQDKEQTQQTPPAPQAPQAAPEPAAPVQDSQPEPEPAASEPKPARPAKTTPEQAAAKIYDIEQGDEYEDYEDEEDERPRRRFPFGCLIVLILIALVGFGGYKVMQFYGELSGAGEMGIEQTIKVEQGSSIGAIASRLKEDGIIEYDWLFKQYVKYSGKADGIQYGEFELRPGMSYNEIIETLSVVIRRPTTNVTIPEGTTAVGVAQIFVNEGLVSSVDEFLACANGTDGSDFSQYDFWNQIPDNGRIMKCEGYLYPETYNVYSKDMDVYYYVDVLYKEFAAQTAGLMDTINEKGTTLDDVVIMASFIQEEAGMPEEDARVSACFHNRLETDDPLWSAHMLESNASSSFMYDSENNYLWNSPTAEYMGWVAQGFIPDDVLAIYDTYKVSGLPAGPISCPGYAAIEAALNPDPQFVEDGYFFFVTGHPNTDVAGQYFYAKTANEHSVNVEKAGWAY